MKKMISAAVCLLLAGSIHLYAHCQIPCGIYNDPLRTSMIYEDLNTIDKSVAAIRKLSREKTIDYNQLVRWINNKDLHAQKIQTVVSEYFMTQRIVPVEPGEKGYAEYVTQITLLHSLLIDAMKAKQSVDPAITVRMRATLKAFEKAYPPAAIHHEH